MTGFVTKKIARISTLGESLCKHRTELGMSIDKAAHAISINSRYLRQLEKGSYDDLPADIYSINILKKYAELLNLNAFTVIERYNKEKDLYFKTKKYPKKKIRESSAIVRFLLNPKLIKYLIIVTILGGVMVYLGFAVNKITSPPFLVIDYPKNNIITELHQITLQGRTQDSVTLKVNDRPILSDREGVFAVDLNLQNGENKIKITARKKYSKTNVKFLSVYVDDK
jgi:cytoskeletal protein RodZ